MRRVVAFGLLGYLLMVLLGPLSHALGMQQATIDVALIIVLHVAMVDRRGGVFRPTSRIGLQSSRMLDLGSVVTTLVLGYLADVLGSGLKGLHTLGLGAVFLASRALARQVYMAGVVSQFLVTLVASLASSLLVLLVRWVTGVTPGLGMLPVVLAQAALTAAMAPVLMKLLRFLDARLWREPSERGGFKQLRR